MQTVAPDRRARCRARRRSVEEPLYDPRRGSAATRPTLSRPGARRVSGVAVAALLTATTSIAALGAGQPAVAAGDPELPPTGQTFEHYPAMKDVYQDYFTV